MAWKCADLIEGHEWISTAYTRWTVKTNTSGSSSHWQPGVRHILRLSLDQLPLLTAPAGFDFNHVRCARAELPPASLFPPTCLFSIFHAKKAVSPGSSYVLPVWTCRDSTSVWCCLDLMDGGWNISLSNICAIYLTLTWIQLCMALETEVYGGGGALSPFFCRCPAVISFLFSQLERLSPH